MRTHFHAAIVTAMLAGCSSPTPDAQPAPSDQDAALVSQSPEPVTFATIEAPVGAPEPTAIPVDRSADARAGCKTMRLPGHMEGQPGTLNQHWVDGPVVCDPSESQQRIFVPTPAASPVAVATANP